MDLAQLTGELASNFESATERAGLALTIRCEQLPEPVYVDRDMWEKIVLNLLSNAFKFTFEGGIEIELKGSPDRQFALLVVRDTGVGIPRSELPRLFERFHRIEGQKSRSFEGSGIGLALVQELVKLHGGTVEAESEEGKGASFTIAIPYGAGHLAAATIGKSRSRASTSLRAGAFVEEALRWLPDDNPDDAPDDRADEPGDFYLQGRTAERESWSPTTMPTCAPTFGGCSDRDGEWRRSSDGVEALAAIRAHKPDLVLTDVMMPRLDGFGLLSEVRNDPELRDLPVIVLSARAGEDARVEGLDAKADDYLTKPFSARELFARVNANLEMAILRRETTRDLRESEARFRNMAEHAPVIMWMTDPSGSITYINRLWTEYTGQSVEEALGVGAWEAVHPEDREGSRRHLFRSQGRARAVPNGIPPAPQRWRPSLGNQRRRSALRRGRRVSRPYRLGHRHRRPQGSRTDPETGQ